MLISEGGILKSSPCLNKTRKTGSKHLRVTKNVTTSEDGFHSVNNFKVMDIGVSLVACKTQNVGFFETKTLVYLWAAGIPR